MNQLETLRMIVTKCPGVARHASQTILAIDQKSPVIQQRLNNVATQALTYSGLTEDERRDIANLMDVTEDSQQTTISFRLTKAERAMVESFAQDAGCSDLSSYIRDKIGL